MRPGANCPQGVEMPRILLVEDNRVNAMVARKFCESMGLLVDHANDGLEAISRLKHSNYDLIIMDNHMPNMNGLDAIEHIRTKLKLSTVIFACTADVFKEAHDEFIARGAAFKQLEGLGTERHTIIRFPDLATAEACYQSVAYQEAVAFADGASERSLTIIEVDS